MAFESIIIEKGVAGDKKYSRGTYTNGAGDTGGDIDTGLIGCEVMMLQPTGAAVITSAAVVNEALPVLGAAVTIINTADEDGHWFALGY